MALLRILVVEDDALLGLLLAETLAEMGHEVSTIATTEADAVAAADRDKPDLMIVDIHLYDGSGISAVDQILRNGPMPHVIMSGAFSLVDRPGAVTLQKPFSVGDLTAAIQRAIDSKEVIPAAALGRL